MKKIFLLNLFLLTACSKPSVEAVKNLPEPASQVEIVQDAPVDEDIGEAELFNPMELEDDAQEEEVVDDFELVKQPLELTEIDIVDLVKQVEENPAMAELLNFKTQGRVLSIRTDQDASGQRVAIVRLQHRHYGFVYAKNEFKGYFYCLFSLQDGATLKKDTAIEFAGNILGTGEKVTRFGEYQQHTLNVQEVYASCYSPELLADQSKSAES